MLVIKHYVTIIYAKSAINQACIKVRQFKGLSNALEHLWTSLKRFQIKDL